MLWKQLHTGIYSVLSFLCLLVRIIAYRLNFQSIPSYSPYSCIDSNRNLFPTKNQFQSIHSIENIPISTFNNLFQKNIPLGKCNRFNTLHMSEVNVDGFTEAFIGGSVGVMSVAIIVELRKAKGKSLEGCPYCMGNGVLLCGQCLGSGKLNLYDNNITENRDCKCGVCSGRGLVKCLNCQGDGRVTPMVLQSKAIRDPDYSDISDK